LSEPIYEVFVPEAPPFAAVVGYMKLAGAEALYLPYGCRRALHGTIGWMGLETFLAYLGLPLQELAVRPMAPCGGPADRVLPSYADVERIAFRTVAQLLRRMAAEIESEY
jgi:hypothetical protein